VSNKPQAATFISLHAQETRHAPKDGPDRSVAADVDFLQIVQNLSVAVYSTDAAGRITFCNEAAASLWGRHPKLGEDWWCGSWRLYWPDGRPMGHDECPMAVTLKTGCAARGAEAIAERPDGTRVPFLAYPTPLRNGAGQPLGAVNMLVDIADRKRDEEAAQHYAAIVGSSDDAILSKGLSGINRFDVWG
jgi:two-component system, chemotaxis family, CheB/CheR fusion protein